MGTSVERLNLVIREVGWGWRLAHINCYCCRSIKLCSNLKRYKG